MTTQTSRLDPFLLSLPFLASPYLHLAEHPAGSLTSSPLLPSISHAREPISPTFPPSPSLLIALLPLVKFTYSSLRQHMIRLLLAPGHRGRGGALGIADVDAGPEIREEFGLRVQVEDQNGNQQNWARGLVLNGTTVGTFVTYSLSLPIIASLSGRALRWVADYSATLRKFLAIDAHLIPNMYRPAARIGFLGLRAPIGVTDLDPIWWRNAVGLCLFTVTKDAVALFHAWSRREEKRTRRIVSRDFAGLDLQGLDLIV
ncbi:hypothetical protein DACRYDRAFT_23018 [Dacryopinax primogenitus]|uniref:Uncharacterized protein n=1 Tax=Dacryopinax primogenitus (strain DJM 731) TaxID=1858805 RepID=M5FW37_DACPD|nr:uncharacterized protein DACRYDRAFT_23018 [Dacryopinax primogenitus]EJU00579.1 hypothetical protein DACRYDRAFT_23018 [Dacryopinax primogenitus]